MQAKAHPRQGSAEAARRVTMRSMKLLMKRMKRRHLVPAFSSWLGVATDNPNCQYASSYVEIGNVKA
jgi:DNA gyrase inhibitor GyrI